MDVYSITVHDTSDISYFITVGCWSDNTPFSAVRHLRQLRVADISPEDISDKVAFNVRSSRPLFR